MGVCMNQEIVNQLNKWFIGGSNMPLIVNGARGTGKTYAILDFADKCGMPYLYVNFETDSYARYIFEDTDKSLAEAASAYFNIEIQALRRFLLIFDEYQACNRDLMRPEAAGSVSGMKIIYLSSLDIKADYRPYTCIVMKPLRFRDFLDMIGKTWYREVIEAHFERQKTVPELVHQEINDLFEEYLRVGGMPAVIKAYLESDLDRDILAAQINAVNLIKQDIRVYGGTLSNLMNQIVDVVPMHMAMNKPHFMPGLIRRGLTATNVSEAINVLCSNGILQRVNAADEAEEFRLNMTDCGLLREMLYAGTPVREERLEHELYACAVTGSMCDRHGASYCKTGSGVINELQFYDSEGGRTTVDISGRHRRHRTGETIDEKEIRQTRKIRLGEENYRNSSDIQTLPQYVFELL